MADLVVVVVRDILSSAGSIFAWQQRPVNRSKPGENDSEPDNWQGCALEADSLFAPLALAYVRARAI